MFFLTIPRLESSFIVGLFFIGVINLGIGWVENKICLFVIRGVNGFCMPFLAVISNPDKIADFALQSLR